MDMDYADAVGALEDEVDRAVNRAIDNGLSVEEVVKELQRIGQGWLDSR